MPTVDPTLIERIKRDISIADLVAEHYTVVGMGRTLTTAEHDSLKIFTRNNSFTWYSQSGQKGKALGGSVIDWYMHAHNVDRRTAIEELKARLDGGLTTPTVIARKSAAQTASKPVEYEWMSSLWQQKYVALVDAAQAQLFSSAGGAGQDYLLGRGLEPSTWLAFRLGLALYWNPDLKRNEPAIVMPWYAADGKTLRGVRFRFLQVHKIDVGKDRQDVFSRKTTSAEGSGQFTGAFFGMQALETGIPSLSTFVCCEGELNCCSIWQTARDTHLDVLSLGSERATLSDKQIDFAKQYRHLIVWFDKNEVAKQQAVALGAHKYSSPNSQDANDLLRVGLLGGLLCELRRRACKEDLHLLEMLLWDLWDATRLPNGIDKGAAEKLLQLARALSRYAPVYEPEAGRWIAGE
jgi:hypothetical protein